MLAGGDYRGIDFQAGCIDLVRMGAGCMGIAFLDRAWCGIAYAGVTCKHFGKAAVPLG